MLGKQAQFITGHVLKMSWNIKLNKVVLTAVARFEMQPVFFCGNPA